MATYREEIIGLIEPVIESEGLELVELECLRMQTRWLVRIFIDREGGATLEDCTAISHQVGDLLNVHDLPPGPYTLEVSSPGLDRPLTRDKDFEKYRGGEDPGPDAGAHRRVEEFPGHLCRLFDGGRPQDRHRRRGRQDRPHRPGQHPEGESGIRKTGNRQQAQGARQREEVLIQFPSP